jgi:hypothetical protein
MFAHYRLKGLLFIMTLLPMLTFGQRVVKSGSVNFLAYENGFGVLKLGSDISLLPSFKLSFLENNNKPDADDCLTYRFTDSTMTDLDGVIPLDAVCLRAYKNKIVNIYIFFHRGDGYAVLRSFINSYGLFTSKPDDYADIYNWQSKSVNLCLRYQAKIPLGMATFTFNEIDNLIRIDKNAAETDSLKQ